MAVPHCFCHGFVVSFEIGKYCFKIVWAVLGTLSFRLLFGIGSWVSTKKPARVLIEMVLNVSVSGGHCCLNVVFPAMNMGCLFIPLDLPSDTALFTQSTLHISHFS